MQPSAEKARREGDDAAKAHHQAGRDADPTPPADVPDWLKSSWKSGYMTRWRFLQMHPGG